MPAAAVTIFERNTYSATHNSGRFGNPGYRGIMLFLNVFTASATVGSGAGLIPQLRRHDPLDVTSSKIIWSIPLPVIATGTFDYFHHPDAGEALASVYYVVGLPLPESWSITMTNEDSTAWVYSMTGSFVP